MRQNLAEAASLYANNLQLLYSTNKGCAIEPFPHPQHNFNAHTFYLSKMQFELATIILSVIAVLFTALAGVKGMKLIWSYLSKKFLNDDALELDENTTRSAPPPSNQFYHHHYHHQPFMGTGFRSQELLFHSSAVEPVVVMMAPVSNDWYPADRARRRER
ncbi:hypothetical protein EDC01DRAFT_788558 [Geopyxis carbonaria]|nr:hypothetical protein EDC01DRAFT_788558 [Geopyxis carbonaria]